MYFILAQVLVLGHDQQARRSGSDACTDPNAPVSRRRASCCFVGIVNKPSAFSIRAATKGEAWQSQQGERRQWTTRRRALVGTTHQTTPVRAAKPSDRSRVLDITSSAAALANTSGVPPTTTSLLIAFASAAVLVVAHPRRGHDSFLPFPSPSFQLAIARPLLCPRRPLRRFVAHPSRRRRFRRGRRGQPTPPSIRHPSRILPSTSSTGVRLFVPQTRLWL